MGESLQIKATGEYTTKIKTELTKDAASKALTLYFDGVRMANLTSSPLQIEAGKELRFNFDLVRDANNEENRKAWDTLFKKKDGYLMTIQPALAVGNDLPLAVQSAQPSLYRSGQRVAGTPGRIAGEQEEDHVGQCAEALSDSPLERRVPQQ